MLSVGEGNTLQHISYIFLRKNAAIQVTSNPQSTSSYASDLVSHSEAGAVRYETADVPCETCLRSVNTTSPDDFTIRITNGRARILCGLCHSGMISIIHGLRYLRWITRREYVLLRSLFASYWVWPGLRIASSHSHSYLVCLRGLWSCKVWW